jgi:hypothetical protein
LDFFLEISGKILLSLYIILPLSVFYLIKSIDEDKVFLGFFSFIFIYNWYFNKGFISFVFSIPFFFFALGYWWKSQNTLTWKHEFVLAGLILCVYLTHLFAFVIFLFTFTVIFLLTVHNARKGILTILPFLPSLILLGMASLYNTPTYIEGNGPFVLLYGSLQRRIDLIFSRKFSYFVSFTPDRERKIFLITSVVVLILFIANIRAIISNIRMMRLNVFFTILLAFVMLYLLLPEHVSHVAYIANRLILFLPFLGLLCLWAPKTILYRNIFLLILISLSISYLWITFLNYHSVNTQLHDYDMGMRQIPPKSRAYMYTDPRLSYIGQVTPFEFFDAYYRMERGAQGMRAVSEQFVGPMRLVQLRHPIHRTMDDTDYYPDILAKVYSGGYALVVAAATPAERLAIEEKYGLKRVLTISCLTLYRKDQASRLRPPLESPREDPRGLAKKYDYVLLYQAAANIDPIMTSDFEPIFSAGFAHVFKRKGLP